MGATAACLVHCIALPVLIAALPALAAVFPIPESFHVYALLLAVPATGGALLAGYRRHGAIGPVLGGTVGLVLLALAVFVWGATPLEAPVTIGGSILIGCAHLANWRFRRAAHLHLA